MSAKKLKIIKETKDIKMNQMKILILKTKIRHLTTDGLNSRMEGTEEIISELKDRTTETSQYERGRENRLGEEGTRASGEPQGTVGL